MASSGKNVQKFLKPIIKKLYQCEQCKQSFSGLMILLSHFKEKNLTAVCARCTSVFKNRCAYYYHSILCKAPSQPLTAFSFKQEEEETSCVVLPHFGKEVVNEHSNTSSHKKHAKMNKHKIVQTLNEEKKTRKAETKLIMILHECDNNIREKKPLKSKQICPICAKLCDRDTWQLDNIEDIRLHARVHGTVFLKYSQERLYRAIRRRQMEIPIIKIEEEEDTTIVEIKD